MTHRKTKLALMGAVGMMAVAVPAQAFWGFVHAVHIAHHRQQEILNGPLNDEKRQLLIRMGLLVRSNKISNEIGDEIKDAIPDALVTQTRLRNTIKQI